MSNDCRTNPWWKFLSSRQVVRRLGSIPRESAIAERLSCLLVAVLCLTTGALGQSQSQAPPPPQSQPQSPPQKKEESLGDAARKARAQKGKSEPRKVYTDEDLSGPRSGTVSVVGQNSPAPNSSPEAKNSRAQSESGDGSKSGKNSEEYWRGRARKLQDQMAAVDQEIARVKDDIKKYGNGGFDASSGLKQSVIYVEDRNAKLQQLEKKKADLQTQMDTLIEEGRKAGALPAWFR
jgi:hypothetical protein